jgi:hypothetical protein
MNQIDRKMRWYQRWRELAQGEAIQRLSLAAGISEAGEVWQVEIVEYLREDADSEDFIRAAMRCEQTGAPLPSSLIRRQVELHVGQVVKTMPCPVRVEPHHLPNHDLLLF